MGQDKSRARFTIDLIARFMGPTWGLHGAHLRPTGPRWAPCWPHDPCYLGFSFTFNGKFVWLQFYFWILTISFIIQVQWKFRIVAIQFFFIWSPQILAHTAQLSWHMKTFVVITALHFYGSTMTFLIKFQLWWKKSFEEWAADFAKCVYKLHMVFILHWLFIDLSFYWI